MLKPLNDKVAIEVVKEAKKSAGGIDLLQPTDSDAPLQGTVVAVGPGKYNEAGIREELEVAIGDVVAFPRGAGVAIADHGVTVLTEAEIIAVIS